jgi:transaldolase
MRPQYLEWLTRSTKTTWWHDSADPAELARGLERGAIGATTNPFLSAVALAGNQAAWAGEIQRVLAAHGEPEKRAEELMHLVVGRVAAALRPQYEKTGGATGYVCAQVNPSRAGDRQTMLAMARRPRESRAR